MRMRRNSRHDVETGAFTGRSRALNPRNSMLWGSRYRSSQNPSSSNAVRLTVKDAEALALKNNPAISVARLSALASEQVTREVRSNLWPQAYANLTGSRCPKQQPHHGWGIEQSNRLHPSRRWRYGYPTHHGLWAHHEPGCRCPPSGKSRRTERSRHQGRHLVGRGPGLLQRAADTRCVARGGADRSLAAVVIRPGLRPHEEQIEVGLGLELCQCESGASKASLPGRAQQRQDFGSSAFGNSRILHSRSVRTW